MKRWIAALLSAVLLLSVSGAALAADPDTVEISSAEDLAELSALCTSDAWSEGKTIVLTRDISLTGCDFSPIPLLSGTFDGRGHSILGISLDGDASTQGLFRMVLKTGVVKNLTVSGTLHATGNGENIGGIAGVNYGAIENCRFDGDILAQAAAGGIVGDTGAQQIKLPLLLVLADQVGQQRLHRAALHRGDRQIRRRHQQHAGTSFLV